MTVSRTRGLADALSNGTLAASFCADAASLLARAARARWFLTASLCADGGGRRR